MEPRDNSTWLTKRTNLYINYTGVNFDIQKHNLLCFLEFKKIRINLGFSILIGKFCTLGFTYNFVLRVYVVQWSYILFKLYDVDPYGTFNFLYMCHKSITNCYRCVSRMIQIYLLGASRVFKEVSVKKITFMHRSHLRYLCKFNWTETFLTKSLWTHKLQLKSELEKVVKCPQAENSEIYNVLKIAWFATKDDQKNVY